jgi:hypothetical protein
VSTEHHPIRQDDGKYAYSDMDKRCRCGHTLAVHAAVGPRCCMNEDDGDGQPCGCERFKPAPAPTEGRRECPICGRQAAVKRDGSLYRHGRTRKSTVIDGKPVIYNDWCHGPVASEVRT